MRKFVPSKRMFVAALRTKLFAAIPIFFIGGTLIGLGITLLLAPDAFNLGMGDENQRRYAKGIEAYVEKQKDVSFYWFEQIASTPEKDDEIRFAALYNLGTILGDRALDETLALQERLNFASLAIERLQEAVALNPDDENAKWNYERLLMERQEIARAMAAQGLSPGKPGAQQGGDSTPGGGYSPGRDGSRGF